MKRRFVRDGKLNAAETARENLDNQTKLLSETAKLGAQFILTEVDLAFTFCAAAESSDDEEKKERNLGHARKALESARYFLSTRTVPHSRELERKVGQLQWLLDRLTGSIAIFEIESGDERYGKDGRLPHRRRSLSHGQAIAEMRANSEGCPPGFFR